MRNIGALCIAAVCVLSLGVDASAQVDTAWVRTLDMIPGAQALSMSVDSKGNCVVGISGFLLAQYGPSGSINWTNSTNFGIGLGYPLSILSSAGDTTFAAGYIGGGRSIYGGALTKYSPAGDSIWTIVAPSLSDTVTAARIVREHPSGDLILLGDYSPPVNPQPGCVIARYDRGGSMVWQRRFREPAISASPVDLELDAEGNIYSCIRGVFDGENNNAMVTKHDSNGSLVWFTNYDNGFEGGDWPTDICVTRSGEVYVALSSGTIDTSGLAPEYPGLLIIKYDNDGEMLWKKMVKPDPFTDFYSTSIKQLSDGSIVTVANEGGGAWIAMRLTKDGDILWSVRELDQPYDLGIDSWDNAYVLARYMYPNAYDLVVTKITPTGARVWRSQVDGGGEYDQPRKLEVDSDGQIYVIGRRAGPSVLYAPLVYKLKQHLNLAIDILPGICPNLISASDPIDLESSGICPGAAAATPGNTMVPVAILGSKEYDVNRIDPSTILIKGLSPKSHRLMDMSRPVEPESECECTSAGADGFVDLVLYFDREQFIAALAPITDGEVRTLALSGKTKTGVPLSGSDCVTTKEGPIRISPVASADERVEAGFAAYPNPFNAATIVSFYLSTESDVRLEVYDVLGRHVATLVDVLMSAGEHQVSWNAAGAASGMYFARLTGSAGTKTQKLVLVK